MRVVRGAVEQGRVAVLVAAEVVAQGEDILGGVLVHRRVGRAAYHDESVAGVAYHEHQQAEQCGVLDAGGDHGDEFLLFLQLPPEGEPQEEEYRRSREGLCPARALEGDAEHGHGQEERQVLTSHVAGRVLCLVGLPNGPDDGGYQQEDVDNLARVERHAQGVDEEQLEPSAYFHDARHHAVEHGVDEGEGDEQGNQ